MSRGAVVRGREGGKGRREREGGHMNNTRHMCIQYYDIVVLGVGTYFS